jgi:hypothetical protein
LERLQTSLLKRWQRIFVGVALLAGVLGGFKVVQVANREKRQRKRPSIIRLPQTRRQRLRAYVRRKRRQRKRR